MCTYSFYWLEQWTKKPEFFCLFAAAPNLYSRCFYQLIRDICLHSTITCTCLHLSLHHNIINRTETMGRAYNIKEKPFQNEKGKMSLRPSNQQV